MGDVDRLQYNVMLTSGNQTSYNAKHLITCRIGRDSNRYVELKMWSPSRPATP